MSGDDGKMRAGRETFVIVNQEECKRKEENIDHFPLFEKTYINKIKIQQRDAAPSSEAPGDTTAAFTQARPSVRWHCVGQIFHPQRGLVIIFTK